MYQTNLFAISTSSDNTRRNRTLQFYEDIKKEYFRLRAIKENGVRKYSDEWIIYKVAQKFYRAERTIENIVFNRVGQSE